MNLRSEYKLSVTAGASAANVNGSDNKSIKPCLITTVGDVRVANPATTISANDTLYVVEKAHLFSDESPDYPRASGIAAGDDLIAANYGEVEVESASHGFVVGQELQWDKTSGFVAYTTGYFAGEVIRVVSDDRFIVRFDGRNVQAAL